MERWWMRARGAGEWMLARAKEPSSWAGAAGVASVLGWSWAVGPLSAVGALIEAFGQGGAAAVAVALPAALGAMIGKAAAKG
jgi:hypothetical protein